MRRARVLVTGRVQGVFFRATTQDEAIRRGVTGWVRNLPDGRVEAVFEGDEESVERMVEFCRDGPRSANVTHIDVKEEEFQGKFHDFTIER